MIRGALGGLGATVAMSAVMLVRQRVAGVGTQEPKVITASGLAAVGADSSEGTVNALSVVAHLGYGSSMGAPHLRCFRRRRHRRTSLARTMRRTTPGGRTRP